MPSRKIEKIVSRETWEDTILYFLEDFDFTDKYPQDVLAFTTQQILEMKAAQETDIDARGWDGMPNSVRINILERFNDFLIYQIYGLSGDEIALIESHYDDNGEPIGFQGKSHRR